MDVCSSSAASGDGRTIFAPSPNGQLKMPRLGNYCLTMIGDSPSSADVAQGAEIAATSTHADHAAKNIADADAQTFWASGSDPKVPVDVQLDFGAAQQINSIHIEWEHPAQVCADSSSADFCMYLCEAFFRLLNCKSPVVENGVACTLHLATICKQLDTWGRQCQAPPYESE